VADTWTLPSAAVNTAPPKLTEYAPVPDRLTLTAGVAVAPKCPVIVAAGV
jgi:hypothetical protein